MPRGGVSVAAVHRSAEVPPAAVPANASRIAGPISQRWHSLIGFTYDTNWESDFSPGAPDISTFPFGEWARLLRQTSQQPDKQECLDLSAAGLTELRREIADFLGAVRGLVCTPEQIVVTLGTSSALDLCSRMILDHGDEVWVEEPGFVEAQWSLTAAGAKLVPVPVDDKGLCVAEGIRRAPHAKLIVVTPSHQYPLGISMGLERRL